MKTKQLIKINVLLSMVCIQVCCSHTPQNKKEKEPVSGALSEEYWDRIASNTAVKQTYQVRIDRIVEQLFKDKNMQGVEEELKNIAQVRTDFYAMYWKAYLLYYTAVYYKMIVADDEKAAEAIAESLAVIREKEYENSEYYALLAQATSFSIQFANIMQLAKISMAVETAAQKALVLNKDNLRAYLVLASHNFHTPKMFGGMQKVETYAVEGLACPDALTSEDYAPTWGRNQLYQLLLQYYKQEGKQTQLEELRKKYDLNLSHK
ncbi:hypothetical protein [Myroides odoratus]|uniref:hypothetical protein n=1 Tax=Myroides odoratus TaxID=256 RepID=UPI00333F0A7E